MLAIPCRRGGAPSLTPSILREILSDDDEKILSVSVFDAVDHVTALEATKLSFASFCSLSEFKVMLSIRSPFVGSHASAPSSEQGITGDQGTGRVVVSVQKLQQIAHAVQPDIVFGMSEAGCVEEPPTKKRRTATERSCRWYQSFVDMQGTDSNKVLVPATILKTRSDVVGKGVCIDYANQNETLGFRLAAIRDTVEHLTSSAGSLVVAHAESIPAMLGMLLAGATHIESAVPWQLAAKGKALCLPQTEDELRRATCTAIERRPPLIMDFNDPAYRWDKRSLTTDNVSCRCYSCKRHTRCYMHHLLSVQEMNSEILLVIHNLTQVVDLLRLVRGAAQGEARRVVVAQLLTLFQV